MAQALRIVVHPHSIPLVPSTRALGMRRQPFGRPFGAAGEEEARPGMAPAPPAQGPPCGSASANRASRQTAAAAQDDAGMQPDSPPYGKRSEIIPHGRRGDLLFQTAARSSEHRPPATTPRLTAGSHYTLARPDGKSNDSARAREKPAPHTAPARSFGAPTAARSPRPPAHAHGPPRLGGDPGQAPSAPCAPACGRDKRRSRRNAASDSRRRTR